MVRLNFALFHGGFAGKALFALFVDQPIVYTALGIGWLGAAAARLVTVPLDKLTLSAMYIIYLFFVRASLWVDNGCVK